MESVASSLGKRKQIEDLTEIVDISKYKLVRMSRGRSLVWSYFMKYAASHNRKNHVVCTICHASELQRATSNNVEINYSSYEIYYGPDKSTDRLSKHLQSKHPKENDILIAENAKKLVTLDDTTSKYAIKTTPNANDSSYVAELVKLLAYNYLPFSFVECPAFQELVHKLNKNAPMYNRETISKEVVIAASMLKQEVIAKLKNNVIAITCDKWTSAGFESYLGVTAHFIDADWNLNTFVLTCSPTDW